MIRSHLDPEVDGEPLEYAGRYLAEVSVLEMKTRLFVAEYLTGQSVGVSPAHGPIVVLHDTLLKRLNLDPLSKIVRRILRDQQVDEHVIESWIWLPSEMAKLAKARNDLAHLAGPWESPQPHDRREAVALLHRVYSGTIDLWSALCLPDARQLGPCRFGYHAEMGTIHADLFDHSQG